MTRRNMHLLTPDHRIPLGIWISYGTISAICFVLLAAYHFAHKDEIKPRQHIYRVQIGCVGCHGPVEPIIKNLKQYRDTWQGRDERRQKAIDEESRLAEELIK